MANIKDIPAWWLEMTGRTAVELLPLLRAVERAGISRNDKTTVARLWHERRINAALRKMYEDGQDSG